MIKEAIIILLTLFTYFSPDVNWKSSTKQRKVNEYKQKLSKFDALKLIPNIIDDYIDQK
jgi:hypothetical protein